MVDQSHRQIDQKSSNGRVRRRNEKRKVCYFITSVVSLGLMNSTSAWSTAQIETKLKPIDSTDRISKWLTTVTPIMNEAPGSLKGELLMDASLRENHPKMLLGTQQIFPTTSLLSSRASHTSQTRAKLHKIDRPLKDMIKMEEAKGVLGFDVFTLESTRSSNMDKDSLKNSKVRADEEKNFFPSPGVWSSKITTVQPLQEKLPAWLPWIPTMSQIGSLKVAELKAACAQRGLKKSGNRAELQGQLRDWVAEQQRQHQARITGEYLTNWFEDKSSPPLNRTISDIDVSTIDSQSPNSLADWARSVDLEPLLKKRQDIHRQKREGRRPSQKKLVKQKQQESTKDYLLSLSRAIKAPSSPYSSNVKSKELYLASKEADQLGERKVAIDLLETLLRVTPNDARVYRRLSRMYSEEGKLDLARSTLQLGIRRLQHNPWLWHGLGQLELRNGCSLVKARKYFKKAIDADPTFAHSYHALGTLEHTNGNIAQAMKILKRGVEYCPTNHRLHHALGDIYRGAKMLKDAERSYHRALEYSPPVSVCFALSALAAVEYELGNSDEAREWLKKSLRVNNGRHAQGWVSLAQMEEADGNIEKARLVCMTGITQYERGLLEMNQRYRRKALKPTMHQRKPNRRIDFEDAESAKNLLLRSVPRYRSGDRFLKLYRNWARLEERYGSFESVDQVYERASIAFPSEYKLTVDWACYHVAIQNYDRARILLAEGCKKCSNRHADPYRKYAELEMSLGRYEEARKILFQGAQAVSESSDGGLGNRRGLAELYHTWAMCEWHLDNLGRAEVLFDNALRLTDAGDAGLQLRSFILYSIARLEYYRDEFHLAQHCVGLSLKESVMPKGDAESWELWADIAYEMNNKVLQEECLLQADEAARLEECDEAAISHLLRTKSSSEGGRSQSVNMGKLMRQDPWQYKLFGSSDNTSTLGFSSPTVNFPARREEKSFNDVVWHSEGSLDF